MTSCDVLVLGAGPAGAVAALNLASTRQVMVVDRHALPQSRIGESLPPAIRRLFTDMGLWDDFLRQGHAPCFGNRSFWNGVDAEHDFLRDPDGHGWHIDRAPFETWLRGHAMARGAALLTETTLASVSPTGQGWAVMLKTATATVEIHAKALVDATGRNATLGKQMNAVRTPRDKLVCLWMYGNDRQSQGDSRTLIEAVQDGWWYSAALPHQRRVLAFHTDADLAVVHSVRNPTRFLVAAKATQKIGALLDVAGFEGGEQVVITAAHSANLQPVAGNGWCAAGDAAICFDPLSSQGLFNAVYTGLAAALACDQWLSGDAKAFEDYQVTVARIKAAYQQQREFFYRQEGRWPHALFWQRHQAAAV